MSDDLKHYLRALDRFGATVRAVGPDQWHARTPDEDWNVRELVNHVLVEQLWAPPLLDGASIDDVGDRFDGDQLGDDPAATWRSAEAGARAAFSADGALERTVALSYGDTPARAYAQQMTDDLLLHGWDLARAVGADERLDPELVRSALDRADPEHLAGSGLFGKPIDVPADADAQTRLLAAYGRRA